LIQVQEYLERRERLLTQLQPNSIFIIAAATEQTRSNDTEFHFRQHSDFFYLTGFNEPDAFLVMSNRCANTTTANQALTNTTLFVREKDELAEIWHGRRLGSYAAPAQLKIDMAYSIDDIDDILPELIDGADNLYFTLDQNMRSDDIVQAALSECKNAPKQSKTAPHNIIDVSYLIHNMRLIKSSAEIAVMQSSADISCNAHKRAMQECAPGVYEYQLEAHILHTFAMHGARFAAYNTIVGGGENACILHYTENSSVLNGGDLVLIDAGAEFQGYASDITRTFPVSGRFSEAQKALYTIVLNAQLASMRLLKPGKTIAQAMAVAIEVITQGLLDLGILQGDLQDCIKHDAHKPFFMHGLGHYLGLDVHDVGPYKAHGKDILLEAGMVLTVEPGIYIADNEANAAVPAKYKNIGIRIEDNIVISADGHTVLTSSAPKTIADIEALMASSRGK
jgi:Xaa-Pro aminopeptidase